MQDLFQEYHDLRTAEKTGYTIAQVRTLNNLEREHQAAEASEDRLIQAFQPHTQIDPFKVEHDERLKLPRVSFFTDGAHWHAAVLADGSLDYKL